MSIRTGHKNSVAKTCVHAWYKIILTKKLKNQPETKWSNSVLPILNTLENYETPDGGKTINLYFERTSANLHFTRLQNLCWIRIRTKKTCTRPIPNWFPSLRHDHTQTYTAIKDPNDRKGDEINQGVNANNMLTNFSQRFACTNFKHAINFVSNTNGSKNFYSN